MCPVFKIPKSPIRLVRWASFVCRLESVPHKQEEGALERELWLSSEARSSLISGCLERAASKFRMGRQLPFSRQRVCNSWKRALAFSLWSCVGVPWISSDKAFISAPFGSKEAFVCAKSALKEGRGFFEGMIISRRFKTELQQVH